MFKSLFATALGAADAKDKDELGAIRVEHDRLLGTREYMYVRNFSGGSLAIDSVAGFEVRSEAAISAAANTDKKKIVRASGTWVEGDLNGFYVRVLDDAGAAGAAPEGQTRRIVANSATVITVDEEFTVAVTVDDTFEIHRPWHLIASADGMVASEVAGVLMATLADKEYGWVQRKGLHPTTLVVAAGTTLAAAGAVKAGAGIVVVAGDATDNGEVVGNNVFAVTTDTVLRKALVAWRLP